MVMNSKNNRFQASAIPTYSNCWRGRDETKTIQKYPKPINAYTAKQTPFQFGVSSLLGSRLLSSGLLGTLLGAHIPFALYPSAIDHTARKPAIKGLLHVVCEKVKIVLLLSWFYWRGNSQTHQCTCFWNGSLHQKSSRTILSWQPISKILILRHSCMKFPELS